MKKTLPEAICYNNQIGYCNKEQSKQIAAFQRARTFCFFTFYLTIFSFLLLTHSTKAYSISSEVASSAVEVAGPYTVNFIGATYNNNKTTFSYTVERTGSPQGNGLSHIIFGLGTCVDFDDVISATIDGRPYTSLQDSEGRGTGCSVSGSILKFDGLPSNLSDGDPHTFTFTVSGILEVNQNSTTWAKAGNSCYSASIAGPGCPKKCELKLNLEYSPIACNGDKTTIMAKASGTTATLEYSLNGGSYGSSSQFAVGAGEYEICVREKDSPECLACKKVNIEQPDKISFSTHFDPIKCFDGKTTLTVKEVSGGTGPYEYSINGGNSYQSSNEFEVKDGKYTVCVKDKNGCKYCQEVQIEQPDKINFTTHYEPINCYGSKTTLTVKDVTGGTGPFEYSINGGTSYQTSNEFDVSAGKYTVCVKDKNGCCYCKEVQIEAPKAITYEIIKEDIKCYGDKTTVLVDITNPDKYEYSLDGGTFQSSNKFYGVAAGKHEVCVRIKVNTQVTTSTYTNDKCTVCKEFYIHQPEPIKYKTYYSPITCYGSKTTLYVKEVSGGKAPYKYSLNGGTYQTSNTFYNLKAGWYQVCVKDAKGCVRCERICIVEPKPIVFKTYYKPIDCYGGKTTLYIKEVSGGKAPYKYSLNGGTYQTSNTFYNLKAGWYEVCVKDAKGCVRCEKICIVGPKPIVIKPKYELIKYYGGKTTVKLEVSGGTGPYLYSINGGKSYQSSNTFYNVKAGTYTICVVDKKGCCLCIKVVIKQPSGCTCPSSEAIAGTDVKEQGVALTDATDHLQVSPNPYSDKASIEFTLAKASSYNLVVYDIQGKEVKRISAGAAEAGQLNRFALDSSLPVGIYIVTLTTNDFKKTFKVSRE